MGNDNGSFDSGRGVRDLTALNNLRLDPSKLGCTITGRGLNADESSFFIPELPYRSTCPG